MMKKITILFVVLVLVLFLIVRLLPFRLEETRERNLTQCLLTKELKSRIKRETRGITAYEIVDYSIKLTAESLTFSERNNVSDGMANCIGYAKLCSDVCNYAFKVNGMVHESKPVVGVVCLYRMNLCNLLAAIVPKQYEGFVSDHDFVEITLNGRTQFYFDPCLYDVIGNRCETAAKSKF